MKIYENKNLQNQNAKKVYVDKGLKNPRQLIDSNKPNFCYQLWERNCNFQW